MPTPRRILLLLALSAFSPAYSQATAAREPKLVIEINLPAFRLDARLDTLLLGSFTVAIGMRRYPTPAGDFAITEVEWNPWCGNSANEAFSRDTGEEAASRAFRSRHAGCEVAGHN